MLEMNQLYNMDCMEGMKEFPDKFFDLAIVDPPPTDWIKDLYKVVENSKIEC